jgi:hypothetical protein
MKNKSPPASTFRNKQNTCPPVLGITKTLVQAFSNKHHKRQPETGITNTTDNLKQE